MNRLYEKDESLESQLSALIVECINTGKKLPTEKQMVETFNVSRFALREALHVYENAGIVVSQRGSGRHVQQPSIGNLLTNSCSILIEANPSFFLDLLEVRFMMELGAVPKIISTIGIEELKALQHVVEQMKLCVAEGSSLDEQDRAFHSILYTCVNNTFFKQLMENYWDLRQKYDIATFKHNAKPLVQNHEEIVFAIIAKDHNKVISLLQEQHEDAQYQVIMSLVAHDKD